MCLLVLSLMNTYYLPGNTLGPRRTDEQRDLTLAGQMRCQAKEEL